MEFDSTIWGPPMWFFLHTISFCYPVRPNAITKKKYYEFVQNIPLFIPVESQSGEFSKLLVEYPVTPYLDNRESFIRWVWFIHNKINEKLEKPQMSFNDFYINYHETYKPADVKMREQLKRKEFYKIKEKIIYACILLFIGGMIYYLYDK
jgi:hypothetical protein